MKQKVKLGALSAVAVGVLICLFRFASAYFVDRETAVNVIKIGRISVELDEGSYTPPENTLPGRIFAKAPKLKNTGTKDEFVFLEVTVPKEIVTLLYEKDTEDKKAGEIRKAKDEQAKREIFRIMADYDISETATHISNALFQTDYDIDFSYHASVTGDASADPPVPEKDGWILLEDASSSTAGNYNSYVFAYNKKLLPDTETVTLFDKVQLKSFINGEVTGEKIIGVQPYAIQADGLKADNLSDNCKTNGTATKDDLNIIYQVIQRKVADD